MFKILETFFYVISNVFLIFTFLRFKKSSNKINFIHWLFITFILLFCYNSFVALILSTLYIPVYLVFVSVINLVIGGLLLFFSKGKQGYFVTKKDIVATVILAFVSIMVMIARFGIPFNIAYETCDPGIHFWTSKDFYEQSYLLNKVTDKTVVNFETRQTASYTNMGLIFKMVSPFVDEFQFYIFYIIFDIWMLFLAGMIFYILVSNTKTRGKYVISLLLSIFYFLGYPLNNMIFGFFYSGHAITIICAIFILFKYLYSESFNKYCALILLSLSCFGLFFTYYFFAPVVFLSMFAYMIYNKVKSKSKIISKKFIIENLIIFLPACLFGFLYYIVPNLGDSNTSISTQINLNGYFYNNIYSNFTLLIPIIIFSFIGIFKSRNIKLEHFMFTFLLIFMFYIIFLMFQEKAMGYYLSKNYYLLWLVVFIIVGNCILENYDFNKTLINVYGIFSIAMAMLTFFAVEDRMIALEEWDENLTTPSRVFDVYRWNYEMIVYEKPEFTVSEIKMLHDIYKLGATDLQNNANYSYVNRRAWLAAWFRKTPITSTTENKLFTYLMTNDFFELINSDQDYLDDFSDANYSNVNISDKNWFLVMYTKEVVKEISSDDEKIDDSWKVIQGKENYDLIDRSTCENCTFYDFNDGLLIYKP